MKLIEKDKICSLKIDDYIKVEYLEMGFCYIGLVKKVFDYELGYRVPNIVFKIKSANVTNLRLLKGDGWTEDDVNKDIGKDASLVHDYGERVYLLNNNEVVLEML